MTEDFKNNPCKKKFLYNNSIQDRIISRESGQLEFKESFNWNSKEEYAKTMAAFANNKGGCIVFGIKDHPKDLIGLKNNNFCILQLKNPHICNLIFPIHVGNFISLN